MIKIVINTPKGGVGKTTTATNLALLLARMGRRVLAVDLAGGQLMAKALLALPEFAENSGNKVESREAERVPENFAGANSFDFAVLDTDDSFTVAADFLLGTRQGWRVISPVNPHDELGLIRIPDELRKVATGVLLSPSQLRISVFANMAHGGDVAAGTLKLRQALHQNGIESLMLVVVLPHASGQTWPILLNDDAYRNALKDLLEVIGIV